MFYINKERIQIVKATLKDSKFFYNLRNLKRNRRYSENTDYIPYRHHSQWFKKTLKESNYNFFLVKIKKVRIGYVRFNIKSKKNYFVSIVIKENYLKKGIGTFALNMLEARNDGVNYLAKVNSTNYKSINFFKKNGYTVYKKLNKKFLLMKKKPSKKNEIIDKIEKIRSNNNSNWMNILRIAYKFSPLETSKIMKKIYNQDKNISKLTKLLSK